MSEKIAFAHEIARLNPRIGDRLKKYRFKAVVKEGDGGGAYVLFPYDAHKEFGTKGRVPVNATFNGVAYSGSLMNYGGHHMLGVLKAIRQRIGAKIGDEIEVEIWKDESVRTVTPPADLLEAMGAGGVLDYSEGLSYTQRKEYCDWLNAAKKEETRARRLAKAVAVMRSRAKAPS